MHDQLTRMDAPQLRKFAADDYSGYKALFSAGVIEGDCLAHARRKFYDLWVNHHSALPRKR